MATYTFTTTKEQEEVISKFPNNQVCFSAHGMISILVFEKEEVTIYNVRENGDYHTITREFEMDSEWQSDFVYQNER